MAQIVTITNPLTGQPAQVDQLDHTAQEIDDAIARALPGGAIDTLLAGKAPAGYGLGTTPKQITDWNAANVCGWYNCDSGAANSPDSNFGWFGLTYATGNPEIFVQDAFALVNVDKYYHRRRMYYPGTGNGTPWEWVDPPLYEGVEYRTTERYKWKPVYIKAVDTGALPNATFKFVEASFPNANAIVDYGGEAYQDADHFIPLPCLKYGTDSYNNEKGVQVTISNGYGITIATMTDFSSFKSSSVWVKYTKSTD